MGVGPCPRGSALERHPRVIEEPYGTKRRHLGYLAARHVEGSRGQNLDTTAKAILIRLDWRPRASRSVGQECMRQTLHIHSAFHRQMLPTTRNHVSILYSTSRWLVLVANTAHC